MQNRVFFSGAPEKYELMFPLHIEWLCRCQCFCHKNHANRSDSANFVAAELMRNMSRMPPEEFVDHTAGSEASQCESHCRMTDQMGGYSFCAYPNILELRFKEFGETSVTGMGCVQCPPRLPSPPPGPNRVRALASALLCIRTKHAPLLPDFATLACGRVNLNPQTSGGTLRVTLFSRTRSRALHSVHSCSTR